MSYFHTQALISRLAEVAGLTVSVDQSEILLIGFQIDAESGSSYIGDSLKGLS